MTRVASDPELSMLTQMRWVAIQGIESEYRFDPKRRWRFDFAWPELRIALEVEGGSYIAGRHTRGTGYAADCEKYSEAALAGWLVIRVTPEMVDDGRALALVDRALAVRKATAS